MAGAFGPANSRLPGAARRGAYGRSDIPAAAFLLAHAAAHHAELRSKSEAMPSAPRLSTAFPVGRTRAAAALQSASEHGHLTTDR